MNWILDPPYDTSAFSSFGFKVFVYVMDAIVFESVSKVFRHRPAFFNCFGRERRGKTRALSDVSFSLPAGRILVLLGPNGSGKTTLLKLVSTMLLPDVGRVFVNSTDTLADPHRVRQQIGFAVSSERSFFPRLSARENLDFFATLDDVPRTSRGAVVDGMLQAVGLVDQAHTMVMKFSSGMFQRLGMARALIKNPAVLLLDEPTRSIDPESAQHCWKIIRSLAQGGTTVLLATHSFEEATALGDQVAVLLRGVLAARHQIADVSGIEELRAFYFRTTGAVDETRCLIPQGA